MSNKDLRFHSQTAESCLEPRVTPNKCQLPLSLSLPVYKMGMIPSPLVAIPGGSSQLMSMLGTMLMSFPGRALIFYQGCFWKKGRGVSDRPCSPCPHSQVPTSCGLTKPPVHAGGATDLLLGRLPLGFAAHWEQGSYQGWGRDP